jgi:hypothetical protein
MQPEDSLIWDLQNIVNLELEPRSIQEKLGTQT